MLTKPHNPAKHRKTSLQRRHEDGTERRRQATKRNGRTETAATQETSTQTRTTTKPRLGTYGYFVTEYCAKWQLLLSQLPTCTLHICATWEGCPHLFPPLPRRDLDGAPLGPPPIGLSCSVINGCRHLENVDLRQDDPFYRRVVLSSVARVRAL